MFLLLEAFLSLRFLLLLASVGALLGGGLMLWLGVIQLSQAVHLLPSAADHGGVSTVTVLVLHGIDAFLFGVVLFIFAYSITFGFVIDIPPDIRDRVPRWMQAQGIGQIKHTLVEVVLIAIIIDFTTDVAEVESQLQWNMLVLPVAVLLIAAALRLMTGADHSRTLGEGQ
jgi:uncharacterized membrane protein YqhA